MRHLQSFLAIALCLALAALPAFSMTRLSLVEPSVAAQSTSGLERGYRTGYSDGYQAGFGDQSAQAASDYRNKDEYKSADRAYTASYGSLEDYRDGYRQGFEVGYSAGYERRGFDSTIPAGIARRGPTATIVDDDSQTSSSNTTGSRTNGTVANTGGAVSSSGGVVRTSNGPVTIPSNTVMRVELLTNLSTDVSQKGDRFQARVLEPAELEGAMLEGKVSRVKRAGRVKGSSELQLSFEQISLNGRWSSFEAQVISVESTGGTGVGDVDEEGGVRGTGSTRSDVTKIGTAAAIGAIIGAIAGGGKGAAIGAAIGGGVGTGGAISSRGSDIRLSPGQQLRIRTSNETRIP